jgi:hypothetical protein
VPNQLSLGWISKSWMGTTETLILLPASCMNYIGVSAPCIPRTLGTATRLVVWCLASVLSRLRRVSRSILLSRSLLEVVAGNIQC